MILVAVTKKGRADAVCEALTLKQVECESAYTGCIKAVKKRGEGFPFPVFDMVPRPSVGVCGWCIREETATLSEQAKFNGMGKRILHSFWQYSFKVGKSAALF